MADNQRSGQPDKQGSDSSIAVSLPATDANASNDNSTDNNSTDENDGSGNGSRVFTSDAQKVGSIIISDLSNSSAPRARHTDDTVIRKRGPYGELPQRDTDNDTDTSRHDEIAKELIGTMLGHYLLEELIGGGGMGIVFRSIDTRLNRIVAIKVLTYRDGKVEEIVRRFQQEAQSAAQLAHENIAQVYDVGEDNGWNYIAFEYIDGQNIRDLVVREGPLPVATAISYAMQAAEALNHACEREVVHRDVKPSNLIVTHDGQVKLVDMGLARLHQVESSDEDLTESGMTLGTFDYISPEQGQDPRSADIRSDLYSLGCTLYYMLTGKAPFPHGTALQKLLHHASDMPPDPRVHRDNLPNELVAVLNKLMAKKPSRRYQHPIALIAALQSIADREGMALHSSLSHAPDRTLVTAQSVVLQQVPWLVPLAILLTVVFAIGGFPWTAKSNDSIPKFIPPAENGESLATLEPGFDPTGGISADSGTNATNSDGNSDESPGDTENGRDDTNTTDTEKPAIASDLGTRTSTDSRGTPAHSAIAPVPIPLDIRVSARDEITRLIVIDETTSLSPPRDTHVTRSLDAALRLSAQLPNLREIELRTHAPILVQPVTLIHKDLTIRAAEDYSPIIRIQPTSTTEVTNVFSLIGGAVRLQGLFLIVDARGRSDQLASLFQLDEAAQLSLRQCWIRVETDYRNSREETSFAVFDITAPENVLPGMDEPSLQLADCVIHGNATVVRSTEATPFAFDWANGFLATSGRLLSVGGTLSPLDTDRQITVQLDHVTAVIDKGLIRLEATLEAAGLIAIDAECTNCIFIGSPRHPLVEQVAFNVAVDRLEDSFHFQGRRNFYEDISVFWQTLVRDELDPRQRLLQNLTFYDWRDHWKDESSPRWDAVQWQHRPVDDAPRHALAPDDFALSRLPGNPARLAIGGMERADAGMNIDALPQPPRLVGVTGSD